MFERRDRSDKSMSGLYNGTRHSFCMQRLCQELVVAWVFLSYISIHFLSILIRNTRIDQENEQIFHKKCYNFQGNNIHSSSVSSSVFFSLFFLNPSFGHQ